MYCSHRMQLFCWLETCSELNFILSHTRFFCVCVCIHKSAKINHARLHKNTCTCPNGLDITFLHEISCFLLSSTSQGSAPSVVFLQTAGLVDGVSTGVVAGAVANCRLQDPATTRVRILTPVNVSVFNLSICWEIIWNRFCFFFPVLFKANYSYEGSGGSGYRKFTRWAEWV